MLERSGAGKESDPSATRRASPASSQRSTRAPSASPITSSVKPPRVSARIGSSAHAGGERRGGGGEHAGAARQRLAFDAALEAADGEVVAPAHLDEVDVGALGAEVAVTAQRRRPVVDRNRLDRLVAEADQVWNADVERASR